MAKQNFDTIENILKAIYQTCGANPSVIKTVIDEIEDKEFKKLCKEGDWIANGIGTITLKSFADGVRVIGVMNNGLVLEDTHKVIKPKDLNLMPLELLTLIEKVREEWERL